MVFLSYIQYIKFSFQVLQKVWVECLLIGFIGKYNFIIKDCPGLLEQLCSASELLLCPVILRQRLFQIAPFAFKLNKMWLYIHTLSHINIYIISSWINIVNHWSKLNCNLTSLLSQTIFILVANLSELIVWAVFSFHGF